MFGGGAVCSNCRRWRPTAGLPHRPTRTSIRRSKKRTHDSPHDEPDGGRPQMNLTEKLLPVALLGAEWVLWLLVILSVASVTIMIERFYYFRSTKIDVDALRKELRSLLGRGESDMARRRVEAMT